MASGAVGSLVGRSAFAASISTRNNNGSVFTSKNRPFFGNNRVAFFPSDAKSLRWTKRASGLIQVQLNDYGFGDQSKDYQPNSEFYKVEAVLRYTF